MNVKEKAPLLFRLFMSTALALISLLTVNVLSAAAQDRGAWAQDRCADALRDLMRREVGGRDPQVILDYRSAQFDRINSSQTNVRGRGRYSRNQNDEGQSFTYECQVNTRSGRATATYRWSGRFPNDNWDNGNNHPGDGWGAGGYRPNGRVMYSGPITNRNSAKSLDVVDRSTQDEAEIQQWSYADQSNQRWDVIDLGRGEFAIVSQGSRKVLDVSRGRNRDGAGVQQYHWQGDATQRWRLQKVSGSYYQIINVGSGKCLDVVDFSRQDGAPIQQWSCSGGANQAWKLGR